MSVAGELTRGREGMAAGRRRAGGSAGEVALVGVSKGVTAQRVAEAHAAGLQDVGENRVQEAAAKIEALAAQGVRLAGTWSGIFRPTRPRL